MGHHYVDLLAELGRRLAGPAEEEGGVMGHHYYDDYRQEPALLVEAPEPEPVQLWGETWLEFPSLDRVTIAPYSDAFCILTWPRPGTGWRFQAGIVRNADLAPVLFP